MQRKKLESRLVVQCFQKIFHHVFLTGSQIHLCLLIIMEEATGGVLQKEVFLKNSQISQENTFRFATLLKGDSNNGVFL